MIKNHKLLVDQNCPMCRQYSKLFTRTRWIEVSCPIAYQSEEAGTYTDIDQDRARNEIAMLDMDNGTVTYGVSTIIKIVTQNHPTFRRILHLPIIFNLLSILYKFISYNRKVITPAAQTDHRSCHPDFHIGYNWTYIFLVSIATGVIVHSFTIHLFPYFDWPHHFSTELLICFGQVAWQSVAIHFFSKKNSLTYLGNMSTVSMIGAILLLPMIALMSLISLSVYVKLLIFFTVIGVMFIEHIRRCHLLGISSWMTVSWVLYRMTALSILIFLNTQ